MDDITKIFSIFSEEEVEERRGEEEEEEGGRESLNESEYVLYLPYLPNILSFSFVFKNNISLISIRKLLDQRLIYRLLWYIRLKCRP